MSTFFISDLHLGHENIMKFAAGFRTGETIEDHDQWLINNWNSVISKRDLVWVLGDVAIKTEHLYKLNQLKGRKKLVLGNHDDPNVLLYTPYFEEICGLVRYKEFWLSHCPIHPAEFRKRKFNIHGHVHQNSIIGDSRYINVCVEALNGIPIELEYLRKKYCNFSKEVV